MNVSYRWLKALLPALELTPDEVAEALALRGAPVETLVPLAKGLEDIVVARVEEVQEMAGGTHLRICTVNAGGEPRRVVCGAPNVRRGGRYPFAQPGSRLPSGEVIQRIELRGVESEGMLCSEAELGLGPDSGGLLELDPSCEPGEGLAHALELDDWALDVEVTANRGDLLSHVGVARELAGVVGGEVVLPSIPAGRSVHWALSTGEMEVQGGGVTVRIEAPDLCARYLGAVIRGVRVGPSPAWLANRIRAGGGRPINNVVDATNYVLMELGQPLHAFDLARLGEATIVVRRAREGELIRTLDGEDRRLESDMLAICDASHPVAVAGVMGGEESEVTQETTDILLECALFEPSSIRATRRTLDMSTDASYRFERGVDPEGMELALRRTVEIVLATAGGSLDPLVLDASPHPWEGLEVPLRPGRVSRLLGVEIPPDMIEELLRPLGFAVERSEPDRLLVTVPGFRSYDVRREVDLIEEIARTYGYDRFPSELGPFRPGTVPDHPLFLLEDEVREALVGLGFYEAQTMAFAPGSEGEVEVKNPISLQESYLRSSLLPGLLRRVEHNFARGQRDLRLFELGTVFHLGPSGAPPDEGTHLGIVMCGRRAPRHWSGGEADYDLWDLKGLLGRLPGLLRLESAELREGAPEGVGLFGAEGFTLVGPEGTVIGGGGRVAGGGIDRPAWAPELWALEVALPSLPRARSIPVYRPLPLFPSTDRDLALVVPDELPAREVAEVIRKSAGPLLEAVEIFDLYRGEKIPVGHRSLAFRLRFQSAERTLTDREVDERMATVRSRLQEELGVQPRQ